MNNKVNCRPINFPIYQTASFYFDSFDQLENIFSLKEKNFVYTRGGNPTVNLVEEQIAKLENGVDAVCFSSGMGAISTTLFSILKANDALVVSDMLYGSTMSFIKNILTRCGIKVIVLDLSDIAKFEQTMKSNKRIKAVFFETPCNPTLKLIDIKNISEIARKHHAKTVVDNTLVSAFSQTPLDLGADVVVHSLTKYFNGHGTALGGIAISKDPGYIIKLKFGFMCELGSCMDPMSAFLVLNGLKTYRIRMENHESNAVKIASFLEKHKAVKKVIYPGLKNFSYKNVYAKQMKGYGSIISFYLKTKSTKEIEKFILRLKYFSLAVSFGETHSLVSYPLIMTHREYLNNKKSKTYNDLVSLIRLSIGLDDPYLLINDLKNSLDLL